MPRPARLFLCVPAFSLALLFFAAGPLFARDDAATARVHARLNSPERAAAIEEARRIDAEARAEFAAKEARGEAALSPSTPPTGGSLQPGAGYKEQVGASSSVSSAPERGQGASPLRDSKGRSPLAAGGANTAAAGGKNSTSAAERPKTMTEVIFNGLTGFMGMPGLAGPGHDPYGPNADQGLGFHQDGTARRADGTTGNNAASSNFDGRRAASYAGHGMSGGQGYGNSDPAGFYGAGYDPVTNYNYRLGDPALRGGRRSDYGMGGLGGFGGGYADPQQYFMQRGLNYGMGFLNTLGEAAFTQLTDKGRARLNFQIDVHGRVNGEGDLLFPFYDGQYTTVFTQVGARSMSGMSNGEGSGYGHSADRWIGNFGLGQRWFPFARDLADSGNLMLGYNVFFDNDFSRSHQRGGVGVEAQYDFIRLASNYYFPLSSWKGSFDYDSKFVEERPAQGWDIRLKGYLPFYRNVALTGAYTQWYGDHVSMFSSNKLEKNPSVWSYGIEYTPVPLISAYWNQRSTELGRNDTEFGLRLTYHFDMPWDKQLSHAKVAEMRTVSGARHEFVDRENRIILEYRAKNAYRIEYLGPDGSNGHMFRLSDGFGKYASGRGVTVTTTGAWLAEGLAAPFGHPTLFARALRFVDAALSPRLAHAAGLATQSYFTNNQGIFIVRLDPSAPPQTTVIVRAGGNTQSFTLAGGGGSALTLTNLQNATPNPAVGGNSVITVEVKNADGSPAANLPAGSITWTTRNNASSSATVTTVTTGTDASGVATFTAGSNLLHVMYVQASAGGSSLSTTVRFGAALTGNFITGYAGDMDWDAAVAYCASQGGRLPTAGLDGSSASPPQNANGDFRTGQTLGFLNTGSYGDYWTRDVFGSYPDGRWAVLVHGDGDVDNASPDHVDSSLRVACVR